MVHAELNRQKSKELFILVAAISAYIFFRFLTLLTAIENVSWTEELGIGTIARELILGLKKPFFAYQIDCYAGESLISALLTAPFFKVFGSHLLVLKAVTLICSALTVLTAANFLNRHFGIKAAGWTIFFLTFSPPAFTAHSLIPMNGHSESLLWSVLMLTAFYEFIFSEQKSAVFLCLFGALGGFSFWFYYGCGIAFAVCLMVWFFTDRSSLFSKKGVFAILSFLVGFSPWLIVGLAHSFDGGRYLFSIFRNPDLLNFARFFTRLFQQLFLSLPRAFAFLPPDNQWRELGAYGYFICFILILASFFRFKGQNKKNLFFLIYPLTFLFTYAITDFAIPQEYPQGTVEFRYYTPLYFFGVMLLGLSLNSWNPKKWFLYPLLIFSLTAQGNVFFKEAFAEGMRYKGYSYIEHGVRWETAASSGSPFSGVVKRAFAFPDPESRYFFWGRVIGWEGNSREKNPHDDLLNESSMREIPLSWRPLAVEVISSFLTFHHDKSVKELLRIADAVPAELRGYFYKGIFEDFMSRSIGEILEDPKILDPVGTENQNWFYWSLGSHLGYQFFESKKINPDVMVFINRANTEAQKWFYRGLGNAAFGTDQPTFFINTDFMRQSEEVRKIVPSGYEGDFYWGVGWVIKLFFREDRSRARDWLQRVRNPFRESAAQGFAACEVWYGLN